MLPKDRDILVRDLPGELAYPYFKGREAAWVLHQRLKKDVQIARLRRGPLGALVTRPGIRETVTECGDGRLTAERLLPLADPLRLFEMKGQLPTGRPAEAAFDALCAAEILPFIVTFDSWLNEGDDDLQWNQTSRRGCNLVVQVNFPDSYAEEFRALFGSHERANLEYWSHPVRRDGPITMSWARLDMDPDGEEVLIEEIQSDWLRAVSRNKHHLKRHRTKSDRALIEKFIEITAARFGKVWAEATMLAALAVARNLLRARRIWLHQPHSGAKLKRITDRLPPRSIYTDLPRRFCFEPTHRAPEILYRARSQAVHRLRRQHLPVFWMMDLEAPAA